MVMCCSVVVMSIVLMKKIIHTLMRKQNVKVLVRKFARVLKYAKATLHFFICQTAISLTSFLFGWEMKAVKNGCILDF